MSEARRTNGAERRQPTGPSPAVHATAPGRQRRPSGNVAELGDIVARAFGRDRRPGARRASRAPTSTSATPTTSASRCPGLWLLASI